MTFALEYFNKDTFCSVDICLNETFSRKRKLCNWKEIYCSPIILFEDSHREDDNHVILREAEQCRTNTWLWVVHSSGEGEAHFVLERDILDAVSIIQFCRFM